MLSEEDTGTGKNNHKNGSATEWCVAFYNPVNVQVVDDLPGGFLAKQRSNHNDYERVTSAVFAQSKLQQCYRQRAPPETVGALRTRPPVRAGQRRFGESIAITSRSPTRTSRLRMLSF